MGLLVAQINIDDSSDRTITGRHEFDRAAGGIWIPPQGTSFPGSPDTGEFFWRTDEEKLFRWTGTAWATLEAVADLSGSTTDDLAEGTTRLYYTEVRVSANTDVASNTTHRGLTNNPHSVTKTQVGLGNVTDDAQLKRAAADFATFTEKTSPVSADVLLVEDSADSGTKKRVQIGSLPVGVFGADFQRESSEDESSTTSSTFQDKVTLTTPALTGTYRVAFFTEWATANSGSRGPVRLYNSTDDVELCLSDFRGVQSAIYYTILGFAYVTMDGAKTFKFQFRSFNNSTEITVRRCRLEFWRVS